MSVCPRSVPCLCVPGSVPHQVPFFLCGVSHLFLCVGVSQSLVSVGLRLPCVWMGPVRPSVLPQLPLPLHPSARSQRADGGVAQSGQ